MTERACRQRDEKREMRQQEGRERGRSEETEGVNRKRGHRGRRQRE